MNVVILAGGTGTRLKEMTEFLPKPLIPVGGKPIIWHIMQRYMRFDFNRFILALGYKQEAFKNYFAHFKYFNNDCTFTSDGLRKIHYPCKKIWSVTLADTGADTLKGGRLFQVKQYIRGDTFMVTYGDGLCDIDLRALVAFHHRHGGIGTVTGVQPISKFGVMKTNRDRVTEFSEKAETKGQLMNGGFMVFDKRVFDFLNLDCDLEVGPLEQLARSGELFVYRHKGFWRNMDTLKDLGELQAMWDEGDTPWLD